MDNTAEGNYSADAIIVKFTAKTRTTITLVWFEVITEKKKMAFVLQSGWFIPVYIYFYCGLFLDLTVSWSVFTFLIRAISIGLRWSIRLKTEKAHKRELARGKALTAWIRASEPRTCLSSFALYFNIRSRHFFENRARSHQREKVQLSRILSRHPLQISFFGEWWCMFQ